MNQSTWKTYTIPFTYHERIQPPRGAPIPIYTRGGQRVTHKTNPEWFYPPQSHKVTFQAKELSKVTFQKGEDWSDTNRKYNAIVIIYNSTNSRIYVIFFLVNHIITSHKLRRNIIESGITIDA